METRRASERDAAGAAPERLAGLGEAVLRGGQAHGRGLALQTGFERAEPRGGPSQPAVDRCPESVVEIVDALLAAADGVAQPVEDLVGGELLVALPRVQELVAGCPDDPALEGCDPLLDAVLG